MKTGIVRKLDDLNRVCLPKDMCKTLGIAKGDPMEIVIESGNIILKPYCAADEIWDLAIRINDRLKSDGYSKEAIDSCTGKLGDIVKIVEGEKK